jgi:gliding motility-associated-like protein
MKNIPKIFLLFLLYSTFSVAQLSPFTLNVSFTNETCLNNGTLSSTTQNTAAGAVVTFQTFRLPNLTTPISTNEIVTGLSASSYLVRATQTVVSTTGTESNFQEQTITISNQLVNLEILIEKSTTSNCGTNGSLIVNTISGNPISYEIIQGPILMPLQTSNIFTGLIAGQYQIRVFDICGNSIRKDFTLILIDPVLSISDTSTPPILTSCTSVQIENTVTVASGASIAYPLTVVFTIYPPNGGSNIVTNEIIQTGNPTTFDYIKTLSINSNLPFTYDIVITDACNSVFQSIGNNINPNPRVILSEQPARCSGKILTIGVSNFIPPYTVNFLQSPAGFLPTASNSGHPGPFTNPSILYGNTSNPVPFGTYQVEITDACGRNGVATFNLIEDPIVPIAVGTNNGCGSSFGRITIAIGNDRKIVSAIVTAAPASYGTIPNNVSSLIDTVTGTLTLQNLPLGLYNFTITDDCGDTFSVTDVRVPEFVKTDLVFNILPNCVFGSGSIRVTSGNGAITSIRMIEKPLNYSQTLPFDATPFLNLGSLYLTDLPAGTYTFEAIDVCGYTTTSSVTIVGYDRSLPGFSIQRNCGTYNLILAEGSNGVLSQSFWLQKFNPITNRWEHPTTGVVYNDGTIPNATTGQQLTNYTTNFNLLAKGTFRILKTFQTYNNGNATPINKICIDDLGQFEYDSNLRIEGAYSLDCEGGSGANSMVVDVIGVPPYNFSIISRDGNPFFINYGSNNTFTGLAQGSYVVSVTDNCGGRTATFTLSNLVGLSTANQPSNIIDCRLDNNQTNTFDLTQQDTQILGSQNPNNYDVTYYLSAADAQAGINQITNPNFFANTTNPQDIYVRVAHKTLTGCYATTSFKVFIGQRPVLEKQPTTYICDKAKTPLSVVSGFDAYLWSTGETTNTIEVTVAGIYSVTVTSGSGDLFCEEKLDITVEDSGSAKNISVIIQDWTENENSFELIVTGSGNYEYSLDDIVYQTSPKFTNLWSGLYTVYINDKNGCGKIPFDVILLNYPKFFTPNGDGYNERWKIKFSNFEPKLYTYIYDRYAKLITAFEANSDGWDGTLNGQPLPADDYWFVVNREDGRVYKAHFTLKR